jgi:hypothetical protein
VEAGRIAFAKPETNSGAIIPWSAPVLTRALSHLLTDEIITTCRRINNLKAGINAGTFRLSSADAVRVIYATSIA